MAIRTDADTVKSLLAPGGDYDTDTSPDLTPFITTASLIVDRLNTYATNLGITMTTNELLYIESWLAAHFHCCSDQPFKEENTGKSEAVYQGDTGTHLESTKYGQCAMTLDYSGFLKKANKGRFLARAEWLGKQKSLQTDYENRD